MNATHDANGAGAGPHDPFTLDELAAYERDGYLLVKQLFDREEIDRLRDSAKKDRQLDEQAYGRSDGEDWELQEWQGRDPKGKCGVRRRSSRRIRRCES